MGKVKQPGSVPNRHIYSRISYLYQAASYLGGTSSTEQQAPLEPAGGAEEHSTSLDRDNGALEIKVKQAVSRQLLRDMRATSLKTQIRLSSAMKHTVCKYCDTLMIEGETCASVVENTSKGGKKPWADLLVVTCKTCGGLKRFPVHASRQQRRSTRAEALPKVQAKTTSGKEPDTG